MAIGYYIVAGPQAAGKSTLKQRICADDPGILPLEESRQIIVHRHQRKGAIFMTAHDEIEVIQYDIARMFQVLDQDRPGQTYLDETNVFTLGHARAHGIDLLDGFFKQYCDMLATLKAAIVLIDVPPDVSWERRRHRYAERLWDLEDEQRARTMARYKAYLDRLHPELLAIYDRLSLPKVKIDGTAPQEESYRAVAEALHRIRHEA
jgi:deoxyadenosine/deoxycytidine kinase